MSACKCILVGAPVGTGASQSGCSMGPAALRIAGLPQALASLGYSVKDTGDRAPSSVSDISHPYAHIHNLTEAVAWAHALEEAAFEALDAGNLAIFLGGDHSLSLGTVPGVARHAARLGRPQFVLWLDAHPDFHTLETTESGNLHGIPVAYFTGQQGFGSYLPQLETAVPPQNVCMLGLRSVDAPERRRLLDAGVIVHDMRTIDEQGILRPLRAFLEKVSAARGVLHVSLDVDFLDPAIAPAVGTSVPGGATFREAHLVMELLHDSGLVTSLDLVELNPMLDERGRTARLVVDLTASLAGRKIFDRPTHHI